LRNRQIELHLDREHQIHHLDGAESQVAEAGIDRKRPGRLRLAQHLAHQRNQPLSG
jgi:hypothetical protein